MGAPAGGGEGLLKIGEAAERLGLAPSALRFYEDQGLITPCRTAKGTRLYAPDDVERLRVVQALTNVGLPLDRARALASARPTSTTGDEASHKVHGLLQELKAVVQARILESQALLDQIERADELVQMCYGCHNPPTFSGCQTCPATKSLLSTQLMKLVWEPGQTEAE